jgi:hypothetical protein
MSDLPDALATPQTATAVLPLGRRTARARLVVTPLGLVAVGALVAAILLAVPPIIRAAREEQP